MPLISKNSSETVVCTIFVSSIKFSEINLYCSSGTLHTPFFLSPLLVTYSLSVTIGNP